MTMSQNNTQNVSDKSMPTDHSPGEDGSVLPDNGQAADDVAASADIAASADVAASADIAASANVALSAESDAVADFQSREFIFVKPFTVSEVRRRAVSLQKGKLLRLYPKMLLCSALLMLPPLIVYAVSIFRIGRNTPAAIAADILAVLFPLVLGGPLSLGLARGFIGISRGQDGIKTRSLFYAFKDQHFFRALGAFIIVTLISSVIAIVFMIPAIIVAVVNSARFIPSPSLNALFAVLLAAGLICSCFILFRFAMTFYFMAEDSTMKVRTAIRTSVQTMKGACAKLLGLSLSYIGWYLAASIITAGVVFLFASIGYQHAAAMNDPLSRLAALLMLILYIYLLAYFLIMIIFSAVMPRPMLAFAVFYNRLTGWQEPDEKTGEVPEKSETDHSKADDPSEKEKTDWMSMNFSSGE